MFPAPGGIFSRSVAGGTECLANEVNSNEHNVPGYNSDLPEMRRGQRGQLSLLWNVRVSAGEGVAGKRAQG